MGRSAERYEKKIFLSELFGRPESLPVLLFILFFMILYAAGPELRSAKYIFDPPMLLFTLNSVFITGLCLLIAGLSFRSFLRGGFLNVLLLGCGVLAFGLSSFAAGWLIRPPYGPNDTVTVHNIGVLLAAVLFFLCALFTALRFSLEFERRRRQIAVMACTAIIGLGAVLTASAVLDWIPPFFVIGEGPTIVRQVVLSVSVTLLFTSALLMMTVYAERKSGFLLFSINALLLIGTGLIGVALATPGSPLSWLGRGAQYAGNVYLVVAAMKALDEARSRGTTVERALADFFRKSETHYKALIDLATDAIVSIDREGGIILMNPAAGEIFGYGHGEAVGRSLEEMVVPEQSRDSFHRCQSGEFHRGREMELARKDGSIFPAELSISPEMKSDGGSERTIIIRDITERKRTEEAIQIVAMFPIQNPEPVMRIHRDGTLLFSNPASEPVLAEWHAEGARVVPLQVRQAVETALVDGVSQGLEIQIAGRDFSFVVNPIMENHYANLYGWDVTDRKRAEEALQESEERYRRLFESMNEGFALHEMLCDESGAPCDYRFLDVNPAFERLTGLKRQDVVGRTVVDVLPGTEPYWIERYGDVALTGTPAHFESHSSVLGRDYEVFAYRPAPGQFAVIFMDITDRRQAEESLRASYDLLKIAQRAANAGIWDWDISKGKLSWSEEFYALFGLDPAASASFDTWLGVLHPDDRQPAMERIDRSIREGAPLENEYRIIRPDGRERWIRAWGSTLYDENGLPLSMSGICIDATGSKLAEEALRASELRMKAVADHLPVGVWFADETGRIVYGNEAGRQIWAGARYVEPEEFHVYRAWWADTGKPLAPEDWAVARAVRNGETSLNEVLEIECFDGTRKTILNSAVPLKSDDGGLLGVVVLNEDITDRIAAEQALRRSEAKYRSYIEVTGQMGWTANADGETVDDAPGVRQYTGQGFDEMRGWGWSKALHPDDAEITLAVWRKAVEEKQGFEAEYRLRRHDGVYRHFLARALPVFYTDGSVREWVGTCIDITNRKQAEEAIRMSEARFRLLSDTAGRLLATDDPHGLIDGLCRDVMEHLNCQAFLNFMVDERAGRLRLNACAGIPEEEVRKIEWLDYGDAVCGCVARDKARIIAEEILHTPDVRTDLVRSYGIQAYCCHPLKAQDRLIGTLSFGTKTRARFTPEEVKLMRTVADQVAVAMLRIQAQRELRDSEEELRLANEQLEQRVRERTTELILLLEDLEKSRDDLRRLASELVLVEERERKRISVLLHDEVAQALAATKMRLDLLGTVPGGDDVRVAVTEARELLGQTIRQTRALMTDISNPVLYDMGLQVAVEALAEEVSARQGISVSCSFGGRIRNLGQDMDLMIFQVVKELVQNIVKHSGARNASIRLFEERGRVSVTVKDDGAGFDTGSVGLAGSEGGFGLFSIRERVKSYGGRIRIESEPGKGSEVTVVLPKTAGNAKTARKAGRVH